MDISKRRLPSPITIVMTEQFPLSQTFIDDFDLFRSIFKVPVGKHLERITLILKQFKSWSKRLDELCLLTVQSIAQMEDFDL